MLTLESYLKNYISNINEGGAGGHMLHPYEITEMEGQRGDKLLDLYERIVEYLKNSPVDLKLDGLNISIRLVELDGKKQFVVDRGSNKPLDVKGVTIDDLEERFGTGHGMIDKSTKVLNIFNSDIHNNEKTLKKLGLWDDPNLLFNIEYIETKSNVLQYDSNFIAIHNIRSINRSGKGKAIIKDQDYDKNVLLDYVNNLNDTANDYGFEVVGTIPAYLKRTPNLRAVFSKEITININNNRSERYSINYIKNKIIPIHKDTIKLMNGKKVTPFQRELYNNIVNNGMNLSDVVEYDDFDTAIVAILINHLVTEAGKEILKCMDSKLGRGDTQEGIVIRYPDLSVDTFKVIGSFMIDNLLNSNFRK